MKRVSPLAAIGAGATVLSSQIIRLRIVSESIIALLLIAAAVIIPTIVIDLTVGRWIARSSRFAAVVGCGLAVPGIVALVILSQVYPTGGVGYGGCHGAPHDIDRSHPRSAGHSSHLVPRDFEDAQKPLLSTKFA
jgi:hypothetical protein